MTLLYDTERCVGLDMPVCKDCRRKEAGHPTRQAMIAPRAWRDYCEDKIKPIEKDFEK